MSALQAFSSIPTSLSGQLSLIQGMAISQVLSGQTPPQELLSAHENLSISASALSQQKMERLIRAGFQSTAQEKAARSHFPSIVTVDTVETFMTVNGPITSISRTPIRFAGSDEDPPSDRSSSSDGKKHSIFDLNTIEDARLVAQYMEDYPELIRSSLIEDLSDKGFKPGKPPKIAIHTIEALKNIAIFAPEIETAEVAVKTIIKCGFGHPDENVLEQAANGLIYVAEYHPDIITADDIATLHDKYRERQNDPNGPMIRNTLFHLVHDDSSFLTPGLIETLVTSIQENSHISDVVFRILRLTFNDRPELITQELLQSLDTKKVTKRDAEQALATLKEKRSDLFTEPPPPRAKVLEMNVRYNAKTLDQLSQYIGDFIDSDGIFIKTPRPLPIKTILKFNIIIADEIKLIHGIGEVVWKRDTKEASPNSPAGMQVRFIKLLPECLPFLKKLLAKKEKPA